MRSTAASISKLVSDGGRSERTSFCWTPTPAYRSSSFIRLIWQKFRLSWNRMNDTRSSSCGFWWIKDKAQRKTWSLWKLSFRFIGQRACNRRSVMPLRSLFAMCKRNVNRTLARQISRKYGP